MQHVLWILIAMIMTVQDPYTAVVRSGVEAWRPRERPRRSDWCAQHLRLPSRLSAQPGHYDLIDRPYFREILDAVDDPALTEIALVMAPQLGKTALEEAIVASQGEVDAAPMMLAGPDQPYCREERDKIYQMCEETPALRDRIPAKRFRNDRWIDLERCYVFLAWSGSNQRLSGRACKVVLCSEVDKWQQSLELAKQRTGAFYRYCVIYESSPLGSSPWIWPLYKDSDRRTFRVPCPHCGEFQELRFFPHKSGPYAGRGGVSGLQDAQQKFLSPDEARLAAYYICERNGCRIENAEKKQMIRRGRWAPEGCEVDHAGNLVGEPLRKGRRAGYHLSRLYSPARSFGDAAEAWLQLKETELGRLSFFNDWLGLPYEPRGSTPRWADLGKRLAGEHPRGSIPRWAYFLTCGCDVQADRVYWIVRAWGDQKSSWLVDWGCLKKELRIADKEDEIAEEILSSDLAKLDGAVLLRRWPIDGENPCGLSALAVRLLGVDRGYRPSDVDKFLLQHPGERVRAVFGDPKIVPGTLFRPSKVERDPDSGDVEPEGLRVWGVDTNAYKTEIADRWAADRSLPGAWWLPGDILEQPDGQDYLEQITAEKRSFDRLHGRKTVRWEEISHGRPNHLWDCEVYAMVLADMIVGLDWNAANWPWARPQPKRPAGGDRPDAVAVRERGEGEDFAAR